MNIEGRQHIAILCSRLDLPGGIERAVVNTANLFAEHGHTVTLIILDSTKESFYPVDRLVHCVNHPLTFGITTDGNKLSRKIKLLNDIFTLKKLLKRYYPDIIICSEYPFVVGAILAGGRKDSLVFAWEHHHHAWLTKSRFWNKLSDYTYPKTDAVICLNNEEAAHYKKNCQVAVIPNFVSVQEDGIKNNVNKTILSIGWLIPRKGIDFIMQAAKTVLAANPDWTWKLIGDGEMKGAVMDFISSEKLEGRFVLQAPGSANIDDEYRNASFFVMASRFEAFPMVLLEALSHGLPCISFDCPSGPAEIIRHGEDGLIVEKENPVALAEAIEQLIDDNSLRQSMSEKAVINIRRYSPDIVYGQWADLFNR